MGRKYDLKNISAEDIMLPSGLEVLAGENTVFVKDGYSGEDITVIMKDKRLLFTPVPMVAGVPAVVKIKTPKAPKEDKPKKKYKKSSSKK